MVVSHSSNHNFLQFCGDMPVDNEECSLKKSSAEQIHSPNGVPISSTTQQPFSITNMVIHIHQKVLMPGCTVHDC